MTYNSHHISHSITSHMMMSNQRGRIRICIPGSGSGRNPPEHGTQHSEPTLFDGVTARCSYHRFCWADPTDRIKTFKSTRRIKKFTIPDSIRIRIIRMQDDSNCHRWLMSESSNLIIISSISSIILSINNVKVINVIN